MEGGISLERTEQAVEIARTWIGTPYHHQGSMKGIGVDCVGLIRGIYYEMYGKRAPYLINYSSDWGDVNNNEDMLKAARTYLEPIPLDKLGAGHVVLLRWQDFRVAKHSMIMTSKTSAIHAYNRSPVVEVSLHRWWIDKIVYAFTWPKEVD